MILLMLMRKMIMIMMILMMRMMMIIMMRIMIMHNSIQRYRLHFMNAVNYNN